MKDCRLTEIVVIITCALAVIPAVRAEEAGRDERFRRCIAKDPDYESKVLPVFWGDAAFMTKCAPKDGPVPSGFVIWVGIGPDGSQQELLAEPDSDTSRCIQRFVKDRKFPAPPTNDCMIRIDMSFSG